MKRIALLLLLVTCIPGAEVLTVDPANSVVIAGTQPAAPAANEVRVGGGQVKAGGTVTANDVVIDRPKLPAAGANQVVRGDDPRLPKAWVNFDGTGAAGTAMTLRSSYNVTSVVKNAGGDYTLTFATPLANADYVVTSGFNGINHGLMAQIMYNQMTGAGFTFSVVQSGASGYKYPSNAMMVVFGP